MINDEHVICNNPHCQKSSLLWTLERVSVPLFVLCFHFMSRMLPIRTRNSIGGIETGLRAGRFGNRTPAVKCPLKTVQTVSGCEVYHSPPCSAVV